MEDLFIVGAIVVGIYLLKKHLDETKSSTIPTDTGISGAASVSGGYQMTPPSTLYAGSPTVGSGMSNFMMPPPVSAPPPPYYGGAAGTAASGGIPLGGSLRAGVSAGTGTTVPMVRQGAADGVTSFRAPTVQILTGPASLGPTSESRSGRGHF